MCLSVSKDIANRWTDMVLLYNVANDPGKVYNYFLEKNTLPQKSVNLIKVKLKVRERIVPVVLVIFISIQKFDLFFFFLQNCYFYLFMEI